MVDAIFFMNLSTMALLELPQDLSTVVAKDVSKLSMINTSGGFSLPFFSLMFTGRKTFGAKLTPGPATIVLSWEFMSFCGLGGS